MGKNYGHYRFLIILFISTFFILSCSEDEKPKIINSFNLTIQVTPVSSGIIEPNSGTYDENQTVSLTYKANDNYVFKEWQGDYSGNDNPLIITMNSDINITAIFEENVNKQLILGRWLVTYENGEPVLRGQNNSTKQSNNCIIYSIQFSAERNFIVNTSNGEYSGNYDFISIDTISLENFGELTIIELDEGKFEFRIDSELCNFTGIGGAMTYVPDNNFEGDLIELGYDDYLDNYVITKNISEITELNLSSYQEEEENKIKDMTGIEDFSSLQNLLIPFNNIEAIQLSTLVNLKELIAQENNLSEIDLTKNEDLRLLSLRSNKISNIDLSQNPKLKGLAIDNNLLTSIDLSQNPEIFEISITNNQLTTLDVSDLEWTYEVVAGHNLLTSIDISNSRIDELFLNNNKLTEIKVSSTTKVGMLFASNNELKTIDLSSMSGLWTMLLNYNNLTSLDVSQTSLSAAELKGNSNLTCIQVNEEQLNDFWFTADQEIEMSLDCE